MDELDFNITVVGLGLIGGSYAMALSELKPKHIWGVDNDEKSIQAAEKLGIIEKGYLAPEIPLKKSDIVILALYPDAIINFIKENNNAFKKGAIITDVAGVKEKLTNEIESFIRKDVDFIGGHPMAGRESKGLSYATKEIFINASYLFTPGEGNKEENIIILEGIVKAMGCKNIIRIPLKLHDEIIAYTSHLPHIIAVTLMNSENVDEQALRCTAGCYRDMTRVADINSKLWAELFLSNKENVVNSIEAFEKRLEVIKCAIIQNDIGAINKELEHAAMKRKEYVECMN